MFGKTQKFLGTYPSSKSLLCRNQFLALAVKKDAKVDTKVFRSCPTFLNFFSVCQKFCPGLMS